MIKTFKMLNMLLLVIVVFAAVTSYGAPPVSASLIFTRGDISLHHEGPRSTPAKSSRAGDQVGPGECVATAKDSYAEVLLPGNTLTLIGPNSIVRLGTIKNEIFLEKGSLLLQVPSGSETITIITGTISMQIAGGTVMVSHTPARYAKIILLEGAGRSSVRDRFGEWMPMEAGTMLIVPPDSKNLPDPVDVDLKRLVETSSLLQMKKSADIAGSAGPMELTGIAKAVSEQQSSIASGSLIDTNLLILSGTNLLVASDNLLQTLENRANEVQYTGQEKPFTIDKTSTVDMGGYIVRDGIPVVTGRISGNPAFSIFDFSSLFIGGTFGVEVPAGSPNKLELSAQETISVTGPFTANSALTTLKLTAVNGSIGVNKTITASTPALSLADRAKITQASGEYYGVDRWTSYTPIPVGTKLVHGASSDAASTTVAYSNYFASEQAKTDSMVGGNADARLYNGFVQVAPYRNPSVTGDFTYRPYVITYTVMRPMPVAYSMVENNPQHNTNGAAGGHDQYFTPFRRQDLIRLGYIKPIESVSCMNTITDIPRYVALSGRATTYNELNTLAQNDYYAYFNANNPQALAEAERLRIEATDIRNNRLRSSQELLVNAGGRGSDITVGAQANIDGFSKVGLSADQSITIGGWIMGADTFSSTAGKDIMIQNGAVIEAFTDNKATGGGTVTMTGQGRILVDGRVQAGSSPWIMGSATEKAGAIVLDSKNSDPDTVAINVTSSGQILALLSASSITAGRATVQLTSAGGRISVDGLKDGGVNYGKNIVADYGDLTISNTGLRGAIDILSGAGLQADILKIGALGTQGVLNVYAGSRMDANTQIKLFGGELNGGAVVFGGTGTVNLISPAVLISADRVQVNTGVLVNTGAIAADVYANKRYWSPAQGGDAASPQSGTWSTTPSNKGVPLGAAQY